MIDVVCFHHALGATPGVEAFAQRFRDAGHRVEVPDLFDGATFATIDEGVAHADEVGFEALAERGAALVAGRDAPCAVVGLSLGVLPAQRAAQTVPGVRAAVLCHAAVPPAVFGDGWPEGVALQVHLGESDPFAEEDLPAAWELVEVAGGELHLYPTSGHLVADPTSPDHDPELADRIVERALRMLAGLDR